MTRLQKDALEEARIAFKSGNYPEALEKYEYFFDQDLWGPLLLNLNTVVY